MAIQTTVATRFGSIVNAYCRLATIDWQEPSQEIQLGLKIFSSKEARLEGKEPLDIKYYYLPCEDVLSSAGGGNVISFSYRFMRENDEELAAGIDV